MKIINIILKLIRNFLHRIFIPRIDYDKLYSSVWNKEKSDYLRKKVKGKKTIHWYEKKGKGSYSDRKLKHFIETISSNGSAFDEDIPDHDNQINPE